MTSSASPTGPRGTLRRNVITKKKKKLKLAICQHQTGERGQKIYAMYTVLLDEKLD